MSEDQDPSASSSSRQRRVNGGPRRPSRAKNRHAGFAIGPILYLLALIGIGAGILFSGYSQILRSNIQITNDMENKNNLNASATTLSAAATLSQDSLDFCPPPGPAASANCNPGGAVQQRLFPFASVPAADQSKLPANYANAGTTGTPTEVGVFTAGAGMQQLDPYGHFYIYCRWENSRGAPTSPALMIISAGPDDSLDTKCGDTAAQNDDTIVELSVGSAIQRSAIWQTDANNNVYYGQTGSQLTITSTGGMTIPGALNVTGTSVFGGPGDFTGDVTAPNFFGNFIGGTVSGSTGTFASDVGVSGALGVTGNASLSGTLDTKGATTLESTLGVTGNTTLSGTLGVTGNVTMSNALAVTDTTIVGTTTGQQAIITPQGAITANGGFSGSLSGDVTGNLTGNQSGGSVSATTGAFTGAVTVGGVSSVDILPTGDATFAGTISAASFSGNASSSTTATNVSGVVALANGGTGDAAGSTTDLLNYLGVLSGSFLNMGLIQNASVTDAMLSNTGVLPGSYNTVTVNQEGRVTSGSTISFSTDNISDGAGDSATANGGAITFTTSGTNQDIIDSNGDLGLGTLTPKAKLEAEGDIRIDGAAGTNRQLQFTTSDSERWIIGVNSDTEGGAENGSSFAITAYDNTGNPIGTALEITRTGGLAATFAGTVNTPTLVTNAVNTGTETLTSTLTGTSAYFSGTVTASNISAATGYFTGTVTAAAFSGPITGSISMADGSAGSPGLFFTNETKTGLFRRGTGEFGFSVLGYEALELEGITNAVNYLTITPGISGSPAVIGVSGEANAGLTLNSSGSGNIDLTPGSGGIVAVTTGGLAVGTGSLQTNYEETVAGGIYSDQNSATAAALYGTNSTGGGVVATGAGAGVYGSVTGSNNSAAAVFGSNASGSGVAIYGTESTTAGDATGAGAAVVGAETGLGNSAAAVYGTNAGNGYGGYFANTATNSTGFGVYGAMTNANTGYAGYFVNTATTGVNFAGYFSNSSSSGWSVYSAGVSPNYFANDVRIGITSPQAGYLLNVAGGIYGTNSNAADAGVSGMNSNIGAGTGVYAAETGASNTGYGIYALNSSTSGYAGYFNGAVNITGTLNLSGGCTGCVSGNSTINLGSATTANPQISGEPTSGFYTSGSNVIDVEANGVPVMEWTTTSAQVTNNNFNIAAGNLQLGGTTVLAYPDTNTDTSSLAIGPNALVSTTTLGLADVGIGSGALQYTTTLENTAVGYQAGQNISSGAANTFVGYDAGLASTTTKLTGNANAGFGAGSLLNIMGAATNNLALGTSAGSSITSGASNVVIGPMVATTTLHTGGNNILIGTTSAIDTPLVNTNNYLNIGGLLVGDMAAITLGIGQAAQTGSILDLSAGSGVGNSSLILPGGSDDGVDGGTTANRPTIGLDGMVRYNSDTPAIEAFINGSWTSLLTDNTSSGTSSNLYLGTATTANPQVFGEPASGLYTDGNNTIGAETTGVTALYITATQSVGIGTKTPSVTFDVQGIGHFVQNATADTTLNANERFSVITDQNTANYFLMAQISKDTAGFVIPAGSHDFIMANQGQNIRFKSGILYNGDWSSTGTEVMSLINGLVGIGNTLPSGQLDVSTSTATYTGKFANTTTTNSYGVYSTIADQTTGAAVYAAETGAGNTGYAAYFTNTSTGVVNYSLYSSTSSNTGWAGYFDGNVNINGNVAISGTTTLNNVSVTGSCIGCGNGALITLGSTTTANPSVFGEPTSGLYTNGSNTIGAETAGTTALYITATQSVGIGTETPATLLEVNGAVRFDNTLAVLGAATVTGNLSTAGALSVTGTSTLSGTVNINSTAQTGYEVAASGGIYALQASTTYNALYAMNTTVTGAAATGLGAALFASSTGASNTADALFATNSSATGYAGYFQGNVNVAGNLTATNAAISGTTTISNVTITGTCVGCVSAGSQAISALTSAQAVNTIDNANYAQTWSWNGLTTGNALVLSTSAVNTGNLLSLNETAADATSTGSALNISDATTGSGYGVYAAMTATGNTGYAIYATNTGTNNQGSAIYALNNSTSGWGIYSGGTSNNYFAGNVGIGTTAPITRLHVVPTTTNDGIYISRLSSGNTNAATWGLGADNASATDHWAFGQSSSSYTTGGTYGWVGNDQTFIAYPSQLRIGTGTGPVPVMTFTSTGSVGIGTPTPQTGFELTTSGGIYALQASTTYNALYAMNTTVTGAAATGLGAALFASSTGASNTADALFATNSSATGYAGYFAGNVNVTGDAAIGGTTTLGDVTITGTCVGCVAGTSAINIGSSTSANPAITAEPTSGFYTTGANVIAMEENGVPVEQWNTLGSGTDYLDVTPGKSGTAIAIAATSTGGSNANPAITISTAGSGNITLTPGTSGHVVLGSTSYPLTATANDLLYASSSNTISPLASSSSGVLATDGSGVPSIATTIPLTTQLNISELSTVTSGTWQGAAVTVPYGGTGDTGFTANGIVLGNGTGALGVTATGATNTVLIGGGAGTPSFTAAPTIGTSVTSPFFNATNVTKGFQLNGSNGLSTTTSDATGGTLAVGPGALAGLLAVTTGEETAVGVNALTSLTTGQYNTALGYDAGAALTTGSSNILIGALTATNTLATGGNNILIGNNLDTAAAGTSNTLNIGGLLMGNMTAITLGIGQIAQAGTVLDLSAGNGAGNSSVLLPGGFNGSSDQGTTANRPTTGLDGMVRYNSDTPAIEAFINGSWTSLLTDNTSSGVSSNLYLGSTTTANPSVFGEPTSGLYTNGSNTIGAETAGTTALYITATQSVGIGTETPATLLEVNGAVRFDNTLAVLGAATVTGNLSTAGALSVTGTSTLSGTVNINSTAQTGYEVAASGGIYALQASTTYNALYAMNTTVTGAAATGLGAALFASSTGASNTADALFATNSSATGYAGYFQGNVNVAGNLTATNAAISGTTTISNVTITGTCVGCVSAGSQAISALTSAQAVNTIDNANYAQTWSWNGLTTGNALVLSTSAVNTGNLLSLNETAADATSTGSALNISDATTGSGYGVYAAMTATGNTGYAIYATNTGVNNTGYAGYFVNTDISSAVNYGLYAADNSSGGVGIYAAGLNDIMNLNSTAAGNTIPSLMTITATNFTSGFSPTFSDLFVIQNVGNIQDGGIQLHGYANGTRGGAYALSLIGHTALISSGTSFPAVYIGGVEANPGNNNDGFPLSGNDLILSIGNSENGGGTPGNQQFNFAANGNFGIGTLIPAGAVDAETNSATYAGYFTNTATGVVNYGLYASTSSASGWAGYFDGNVNINGNLTATNATISGTTTVGNITVTGTCIGCVGSGSQIIGSATTAAPFINGEPTSGFYTTGANVIAMEENGVPVEQWNTLGSGTDYLDVTPGKSGTAIAIAATSTGGSNANPAITISTAGSGNITLTPGTSGHVVLGSTSYPLTATANDLLYASSSNTISPLASSSSGVLATDGSGVPSIATTIPLTTQLNISELSTVTSGTWQGAAVTVPYGGTGDTGFTANGIVLGNGTGALGVTATGATNTVLIGGGAGTPSFTAAPTIGTSVTSPFFNATNVTKGFQLNGSNGLSTTTSDATGGTLAVGPGALAGLLAVTTGEETAVGVNALTSLTTGQYNTALGYDAGAALTTGSSNILIGALTATNTLATGGNNILIGNNLDTAAAGTSNTLNIGGLLMGNMTAITLGIGQIAQAGTVLDLSAGNGAGNSSVLLPGGFNGSSDQGTTANRPTTGLDGMVRYNSDTPAIEAFINGSWTSLLTDNTSSGVSSNLYLGSTTTANPSVFGEPTSGLYTNGSNTIGAETAGTTALYITATQSVGIGTETPATLLEVNGAVRFDNTLAVLGAATVTGNLSTAGALSVTGTSTLSGTVNINSTAQTGYEVAASGGIYALQASTTYNALYAMNTTVTGAAATGLGAALFASSTGASNTADALFATNSSATGYAGYFQGNVNVAGNLTATNAAISGTTTISNVTITGTCVGCVSAGSQAISALTSAQAVNTIDNANYAQTWSWNGLTTGNALVLSTSAVNTGNLLSLNETAADATSTGSALNISDATTGSGYGVYAAMTATGNTGYAIYATNTGTNNQGSAIYALNNSTSGWGIYSGGTSNNYFAGNVGIGTTAPITRLHVVPTTTNDGIYISRLSSGNTNAATWGLGADNASATDHWAFGQSSSSYTTGGTYGWVGNDQTFIAYPSQLRIGTGTGPVPVMTFTSTGSVGIGTPTPQTGFELTTSGGIYALQASTTYNALYAMNTTVTGAAATGLGAALFASSTGASNTADALFATNSSATGYAGYFAGNVNVTGDAAIGGTTTLGDVTITGTCVGCVAGTSAINIGSSTSANPAITAEPTSGFYTTGANVIAMEENGVPVEQWNTLGSGTDYLDVTPGKSGTAIAIAATSTGGSNANPAITISTAGSGNITLTPGTSGHVVLGSTSYPLTATANDLLYASSSNTISPLASSSSGVLATDGSGVPSIATTIPLTTQLNISELSTVTSGTWQGAAVTVPYGGTGDTGFTANGIVLGNGTGALGVTATGATNTVLIGGGAGTPSFTAAPTIGTSVTSPFFNATNVTKGFQLNGSNGLSTTTSDATGGTLAVGPGALAGLLAVTTGEETAVGVNALTSLTTGQYNTALGYDAGAALTTGSSNTAVGEGAGSSITSGASNIVVGANSAATTLTIGSNNILIGAGLDTTTSATSNYLDIGGIVQGDTSVKTVWLGGGALATNATDGFISVPTTAGVPSGTPTSHSGFSPVVVDTTHNALYFYNGSWQNVAGSGSASSVPLSGLISATTSTSFDNANFAQTWTWNTLSTQTALTLSSTSMTTGSLLSLQDTAVANTSTGKVLNIGDATTGSGYGVYAAMTTSNNSGYALYVTNTGTINTGYGIYTNDTSTTGYAIYANGNSYLNGTTTIGGNLVVAGNSNLAGTTTVSNITITGSCIGCTAGGAAAPAQSIQFNNSGSFGGATGLYYSTTRSGLDYLANVTTANLISLADKGADVTSYAIGGSALLSESTTGRNNIAIGNLALTSLTTGIANVAIGTGAQEFTSTGTGNTALGYNAMLGVTTTPLSGSYNTAIGLQALQAIQKAASENTAVGAGAGFSTTTGTDNTLVGTGAGSTLTTGANNTILGALVASTTLTTGTKNILIGADSTTDTALSSTTSAVIIGYAAKGGTYDVAVGASALANTSTDNNQNTAVGAVAGYFITTGQANTAMGWGALSGGAPITGSRNTSIGFNTMQAAQTSTTFADNTALGYEAMGGNNLTGGEQSDTAVGSQAMISVAGGQNDSMLGYEAGHGISSGSHNTGVGDAALWDVSSGSGNTGVGEGAVSGGASAITGNYNTGVGYNSLATVRDGVANNTAIGYQSLFVVTTGSSNVAVGYNAGDILTIGGSNVVIGPLVASTTLTTGSNNILIGTTSAVDTPLVDTSNYLNIGGIVQGDTSVKTVWLGGGALATNATDGFISVPTTAGVPSGTPTSHSGFSPVVVDTTHNALYFYNGSWQNVAGSGSASSVPLSGLISATTSTSFDNANFAQTWTWNTLSTQTALTLSSTSMTTGSLLSLQDTAVANTSTGKVLNIGDATTGSGYGVYAAMTTSNNSGYALYVTNTGTVNTGYAGYFNNTSASGYAGYFNGAVNIAGALNITGTCTGCGNGALINLGSSTTANPAIASEPTSGFYTTGNNVAAVEMNGVPVEQWNTLGSGTDYLSITPGKSGTAITIAATSTGGSNANPAITISTTGSGNITLTPGTSGQAQVSAGNLNIAAGALQLSSTTMLAFPHGNSDVSSIALGPTALASQGSGSNENTALGAQALKADIHGFQNTAVGYQALQASVTGFGGGSYNTAIGSGTGSNLTYGDSNIIIGAQAGTTLQTGTENILIGGHSALGYNTDVATAHTIYALGIGAGVVVGAGDTAVGWEALAATATDGNANTAFGNATLGSVTTGTNNVGVGAGAGGRITTGGSNLVLGPNVASTTLRTGSNNILVGTTSVIDATTSSTSNSIVIGGSGGAWVSVTGTDTNSTENTTMNGNLIVTGNTSLGGTTTVAGALNLTATVNATALATGTVVAGGYLGLNASNQVVLGAPTTASLALSAITSAITTNTIDNTNEAQEWDWNSLSTQNAFTLGTSSAFTGTLLNLSATAASATSTGNVLGISDATTGSGYGVYAAMTTSNNSGYALYVTNTGTVNTGYGIYTNDTSATGYAVYANGNSYLNGTTTITGVLNQTGNAALSGTTTISNTLNVPANSILSGTTTLSGSTVLAGTTTFTSAINATGLATGTVAAGSYIGLNTSNQLVLGSGGTTTSLALSALTSATGTNTIDNTSNAQTWNWNSLSTQNAFTLGTSSAFTGTLLNLSATAASATSTGNVLGISDATTGSGYGVYAAMTTSNNSGYALYVTNTGTVNTGYGIYTNDTSATGYAVYANGNSYLNGTTTITGVLNQTGNAALSGTTTISNTLNVPANSILSGTTTLSGSTVLAGTTTFTSAINATGLATGTVAAGSYIGLNTSNQLVLGSGGTTTSLALSALTSATGTNTIDNTSNAQTWNWNSLSTQNAFTLGTSSAFTGTLLNLSATAASATSTGNVLGISDATTGSGYGVYAAMTTSNNSGYALYVTNTGTVNTGYGIYTNDTSATGYAVYANGNSYLNGTTTITGVLNQTGNAALSGTTTISNTLNVPANSILSGTTTLSGSTVLAGTTTFTSAINATGLATGTVAAGSYIGLNTSNQLVLGSGGTTTSLALSALTSATGTNTIDNTSNAQTWNWNSLSTQNAFTLGTSSAFTGTLLNLSATAASATSTGNVLGISDATTGSGYGVYAAMTTSNNSGYALYVTNTGTVNTGYGIYTNDTSATGYAVYANGNSYLNGTTTITGVLNQTGNAALSGTTTISNTLNVPANSILSGTTTLSGSTVLAGTTTFTSAINATGLATGTVAAGSYIGLNTSNQLVLGSGGTTTSLALSALTSATGTNTIDNTSNAQTWNWNSLAANTGLTLSTSSMTTGTVLSVQNTTLAATSTGKLVSISNATTGSGYGIYSAMTSTGNSGYAIYATNTGANNTGYAGYFTNTGTGSQNYGVYGSIASVTDFSVGVFGIARGQTGQLYGVQGESDSNSNGAVGVFAYTTGSGINIGVEGKTLSTTNGAAGVFGNAAGVSGQTIGGVFQSVSAGAGYGVEALETGTGNTGYGGYFTNTSTGVINYGLYASTSSSTGYAGYFVGNVYATGNISCGGTCGGGGSTLNGITAATGSSSIDSGANTIAWAWNSLSTGTALTLSTTSMTTGTLLSLQDTAVAATSTGKVVSVSDTTTGPGYGVYSAMTGTGNTGYAGYFTNTGTNAVNYGLYASTSSSTGFAIYAVGNITSTTLTLTSDARAKKNVVTLEAGDALEKLSKMRPVSFNWINGGKADMGFIAQEIEPIYPTVVAHNPDGKLSLEYNALLAPIVAAIQELKKWYEGIIATLDEFKQHFLKLDASVDELKTKVDKIDAKNKSLMLKIDDDHARLDKLEQENETLRKSLELMAPDTKAQP